MHASSAIAADRPMSAVRCTSHVPLAASFHSIATAGSSLSPLASSLIPTASGASYEMKATERVLHAATIAGGWDLLRAEGKLGQLMAGKVGSLLIQTRQKLYIKIYTNEGANVGLNSINSIILTYS